MTTLVQRLAGTVTLAVIAVAGRLGAQQQRVPIYSEFRADAIVGGGTAAQGGAGLVIPAGVYMRIGLDAAGGVVWRDGTSSAAGRVDAIARFLLDPFREAPVGLSLGGGVSVPYASGDTRVQPYLTAVIDVEGRRRGGLTPALQVGFGGGARIGVVLRTSPRAWR